MMKTIFGAMVVVLLLAWLVYELWKAYKAERKYWRDLSGHIPDMANPFGDEAGEVYAPLVHKVVGVCACGADAHTFSGPKKPWVPVCFPCAYGMAADHDILDAMEKGRRA